MKKIKLSSIDKFKAGQDVFGFYLCLEKYLKKTRLGDDYIDLFLQDSTGKIRAKIWNHAHHFSKSFIKNDIVAVKGIVEEFNDVNELNIKSISFVDKDFYLEYGYSNSLIIGSVSEPIENIKKYIMAKIKSLPIRYSRILTKIYRSYDCKIEKVPINRKGFFLKGGLLHYICMLLRIYDSLSDYYSDIDNDEVIMCIFLMNIGYIDYYNDDLFSISDQGNEFNVDILGVNFLLKILNDYKNVGSEDKVFLKNCILMNDSKYDKNINFVKHLVSLGNINNQ